MDVTIFIPYDWDRGYLSEAIAAAEAQECPGISYEIIVQQGYKRVGENINDALAKAKGKYFKGCAEDDILTPNCIRDLYELAESGGYDFVCANAINFNPDGSEYEVKSVVPRTIADIAFENPIHGGTIMYRTQALRDIGGFDTKMWTAEEYELTMRMAKAGYKFGYVDKIVFRYRCHGDQKSGAYWDKDEVSGLYRYEYIAELQSRYRWDNSLINR